MVRSAHSSLRKTANQPSRKRGSGENLFRAWPAFSMTGRSRNRLDRRWPWAKGRIPSRLLTSMAAAGSALPPRIIPTARCLCSSSTSAWSVTRAQWLRPESRSRTAGLSFTVASSRINPLIVRNATEYVFPSPATAALTTSAARRQSVPKVYPTRANLAVVATQAERKISKLHGFNRHSGFESHPRLQPFSLLSSV